MASTGAVLYLKPRLDAGVAANRTGGAVLYFSPRLVSGIYTTDGVSTEDNATSPKAMLPGPRTPLGYVNGDRRQPVYIDEATWYRLIDYIVNTKLGGIAAPNLTDVSNTITSVADTTTSIVSTVVAITEQTTQNAAALDTVREVAQTASLPGATQIPPVQRSPSRVLER